MLRGGKWCRFWAIYGRSTSIFQSRVKMKVFTFSKTLWRDFNAVTDVSFLLQPQTGNGSMDMFDVDFAHMCIRRGRPFLTFVRWLTHQSSSE